MPERAAQVNYSGFDPEAQRLSTPELQTGNDYLNARAQPQTEVGQSLQKLGATGEELGNKAVELATYQAGIANETASNNASNDFDTKVGSIYGKYSTLTGDSAVAAAPQVKSQLLSLQQEAVQGMSPAAARATNILTHRILSQRLIDVDTYAAQQQKQALRNSGLNMVNVASNIDEPTAVDDNRFSERIGDVKHGIGVQMQDHLEPHLQTDDNGNTSINDSTPEGSNAKQTYQQNVDNAVGQLWSNRITTLANSPNYGPVAAQQKFLDNKDDIPPVAAAHIDANLAPQVYNAHVTQAVVGGMTDAQRSYADHLTNPPQTPGTDIADAIHKFGEGGGLTSTTSVDGARGGWQITPATFTQYAKPGENIDNPKDNEVVGRRIVDDLKSKFGDDPSRIAVGYFSGPGNVAPEGSPTPWKQDLKDGNGTSVSQYVNKVTTGLGQQQPDQQKKPYATNDDGSMMTQADYMMTHRQEILQHWDNWAEKQMPGDLQFRNEVRSRAIQQIEDSQQTQQANYRQDNSTIIRAINGDFTKGKSPSSYMDLASIPNVKAVLNRVEAQDPRFSQGIDQMIARVNKSSDKDAGTYGSGYKNILQGIWNKDITDIKPLQQAVADGTLTMEGYDKMSKQLPTNKEDAIQKQNENHLNQNTFATVRNMITHGSDQDTVNRNPDMQKAISSADIAMFNAIDDRKARNIPASQYYDPNNKEYIGNDAKVFQLTHAQAVAGQIKANQAASKPRTLADIIGEAKATTDPAKQAQLRQEAIKLGFYDPAAPAVPLPGQ